MGKKKKAAGKKAKGKSPRKGKVKKERRSSKGKACSNKYRNIGSKLLGAEVKEQLLEMQDSFSVFTPLLADAEEFLGKIYSKNKKQAVLLGKTTMPHEWSNVLRMGADYFTKKGK